MKENGLSVAAGVLATLLAACSSNPPGNTAGVATGGSTGSGGAVGAGGGSTDPKVCSAGVPPTSQIPRLANRQYDAVVRDASRTSRSRSAISCSGIRLTR